MTRTTTTKLYFSEETASVGRVTDINRTHQSRYLGIHFEDGVDLPPPGQTAVGTPPDDPSPQGDSGTPAGSLPGPPRWRTGQEESYSSCPFYAEERCLVCCTPQGTVAQ